jgi:hypothetical protein
MAFYKEFDVTSNHFIESVIYNPSSEKHRINIRFTKGNGKFLEIAKTITLQMNGQSIMYNPETNLFGGVDAEQLLNNKSIYSYKIDIEKVVFSPDNDIYFLRVGNVNIGLEENVRMYIKFVLDTPEFIRNMNDIKLTVFFTE